MNELKEIKTEVVEKVEQTNVEPSGVIQNSVETAEDVQKAIEDNIKESEKEEKRLKRKVFLRNLFIMILLVIIIILLLRGCSKGEYIVPAFEHASYVEKVKETEDNNRYVDVFLLNGEEVLSEVNPYYTLKASKTNYGKYYLKFKIRANVYTHYDDVVADSKTIKEVCNDGLYKGETVSSSIYDSRDGGTVSDIVTLRYDTIYESDYVDVTEDEDYKFSVNLYDILRSECGYDEMHNIANLEITTEGYKVGSFEQVDGATQEVIVTLK